MNDTFMNDQALYTQQQLGSTNSLSDVSFNSNFFLSDDSEWTGSLSPESHRGPSSSSLSNNALGTSNGYPFMNNSGFRPMSQRDLRITQLQLDLAKTTTEISMLRAENQFLKSQNAQLLGALSAPHPPSHPTTASSSSVSFSGSHSLSENDFPDIQYWQRQRYVDVLKSDGVTHTSNNSDDGRKITNTSFHFAEDRHGNTPSEETVAAIKTATSDILHDLARERLLPDSSWGTAGQTAKEKFRQRLEGQFPDLCLGHSHWKADWIITQLFSNWKSTHGKKYRVKVKNEVENISVVAVSDPDSPSPIKRKNNSRQNLPEKRAKLGTDLPFKRTASQPSTSELQPSNSKPTGIRLKNPLNKAVRPRQTAATVTPPPRAKSVSKPRPSVHPLPASPTPNPTQAPEARPSVFGMPALPLPDSDFNTSFDTPTRSRAPPALIEAAHDEWRGSISPISAVVVADSPINGLDVLARAAESIDTASAPTSSTATGDRPSDGPSATPTSSRPASLPAAPPAAVASDPQKPLAAVQPQLTLSAPAPAAEVAKKPARRTNANPYKPPKDSTTARALCGHEWIKKNARGTADDFKKYFNDLSTEQKDHWKKQQDKAKKATKAALSSL